MRTIIWFAFFWISLVFLTPSMLRAHRFQKQGRLAELETLVTKKVIWWMSTLLRLAGVEVHVRGSEQIPKGAVLFASNHQGNFDIPILLCGLDTPHGLVAKSELGKIPFIRVWMRYLGCVFLDRNNPRKSAAAMNEAAELLQQGRSMIIFPEGTRSRGGPIGEFKSGAFKIALKTKVPVVPVCIEGSYQAMEAHGFRIHPAKVTVHILPPVQTEGLTKEEGKLLGEHLHTLIQKERNTILAQ